MLRTQRIHFSIRRQLYVRTTRDPTVVWSLLSREPREYPHILYIARKKSPWTTWWLWYWSICIYCYAIGLVFESQQKVFKTSVNARPHCPLTSPCYREPDRISAQILYRQKLESMPEICADSMCLFSFVFTQLFSEVTRCQAAKPARKHILAPNSQSGSLKVIYFGVNGKATRG